MEQINRRAFVEVWYKALESKLPPAIWQAFQNHFATEPTNFFLPWPVELIPSVGSVLNLSIKGVGMSEVVVKNLNYYFVKAEGITAYIEVECKIAELDIETIFDIADNGMLAESHVPVLKILQEAGLPTSWQAWQKKYPSQQ
jgi:hypothetical protein